MRVIRFILFISMERMKDLTQQYVEQLENMVKDLREKKLELEEENKKLKSDLAFERTMLDNVRAEYKSLQNVIKNLKEKANERLWQGYVF